MEPPHKSIYIKHTFPSPIDLIHQQSSSLCLIPLQQGVGHIDLIRKRLAFYQLSLKLFA